MVLEQILVLDATRIVLHACIAHVSRFQSWLRMSILSMILLDSHTGMTENRYLASCFATAFVVWQGTLCLMLTNTSPQPPFCAHGPTVLTNPKHPKVSASLCSPGYIGHGPIVIFHISNTTTRH